jgi:hypothetical protein
MRIVLCLKSMIRLLLLFFLFLANTSIAQTSDILLLKKKNRTVGHFFAGAPISFISKDGKQVSGTIDSLVRDSIFMTSQTEHMAPNMFGGYSPVKGPAYQMQYAITDISGFPIKHRKWGLITSGTLFIVGGSAYLVLNIVNTLREKQPLFGSDNLPRIVGGLSAVTLGLILRYTQRTSIVLGKKYQLIYLPAAVQPSGN